MEAMEKWTFSAQPVAPGVKAIICPGGEYCYLIEGTERALLFDTATGIGRLRPFVEQLTGKPLTVLNSHGHGDHAGGNYEFEEVYIHPADQDAAVSAARHSGEQQVKAEQEAGLAGAPLQDTKYLPLKEGDTFDLGGRVLEIVETPGHTPGSVCLLDRFHKHLFAGDSCNPNVWMFLPQSLTVEDYYATVQKLQSLKPYFGLIFICHTFFTVGHDCLDQVAEMCRQLLAGGVTPKPHPNITPREGFSVKPLANGFNADGTVGNVIFHPDKIHRK